MVYVCMHSFQVGAIVTLHNIYIITYNCIAVINPSGEGVCATVGDIPAAVRASAVVGPIAATYIQS